MGKTKKMPKIRWKYAIPLLLAVILIFYAVIALIVSLLTGSSAKYDIRTIGTLNGKQTYKVISGENRENPQMFKDFNYYGESLILYFDNYTYPVSSSASFMGKTVLLKDLLSNNEIRVSIENDKADAQIDLASLSDGFYSVYSLSGDTTNRLYSNGKISANNIFYTVTRNGFNKKVELIAQKDYFDAKDAKENMLDKAYLYICVTTIAAADNPTYDIAISTAPALTTFNAALEGETADGIVEATEMYECGKQLKVLLEKQGLKVLLLKAQADEEVLFYGNNGTLKKAYEGNVKYLIDLDMDSWGEDIGVLYSTQSSGKLAQTVYNELKLKTTLFGDDNACKDCGLTDTGFDNEYVIREAGGRVLGAAAYSESSKANMAFAANNAYGINTVMIMPATFTSTTSLNSWSENRTLVHEAIASGILKYLGIAAD